MKKTRVIILFGGRSAEHEISLLSARNVLSALDRTRFEPVLVGIDKAGRWHRESERTLEAAAGDPRNVMLDAGAPAVAMEDALVPRAAARPTAVDSDDVVFPVLHGTFGEDGTVQGAMELAGIAYVGAGVLGSAIGMDKDVAKRLLRDAGIPIVDFAVVTAAAFRKNPAAALGALPDLGYPRYVKPANAGSSVGVSRVAGPGDLERAVRAALAFDTQGAGRARGRRARDRMRGARQRRAAGIDPGRDRRPSQGRLLFVRRQVRRSRGRELEDPRRAAAGDDRRACRPRPSRRSARSSCRAWRASTSS